MIVEDNSINQKVAAKIVEKHGCQAFTVANGEEAIDAFQQQRFDVILMDVQMPVMDGLTATRRIREIESENNVKHYSATERIPIIAMTANAMKSDRERCLEAGMDDYIAKPVDPEMLVNALRQWLNGGRTAEKTDLNEEAATQVVTDDKAAEEPPIDMERAMIRTMGDASFLYELIDEFIDRQDDHLQDIARAVEADDSEKVKAHAHFLKGAAANLSADKIASVAATLEKKGRNGDLNGCRQMLESLRQEYKHLKSYTNNYRRQNNSPDASSPA